MATRLILSAFLCSILIFGGACATCSRSSTRQFSDGDRLSFRNDLQWIYTFHEDGSVTTVDRSPPPEYPLHCFPMVRTAREFFYHARFVPGSPRLAIEEYNTLVRAVIRRDSRCPSPEEDKIPIPGYRDLAEFSSAHEALLKDHCGTIWNSYTQRGNWRMVFPFSRRHQRRTAAALNEKLAHGQLPIVHLADFPGLRINHSILLINAQTDDQGTVYTAYDPNRPERFATLRFDSATNGFMFERNDYFAGGPVSVYEVYRNLLF